MSRTGKDREAAAQITNGGGVHLSAGFHQRLERGDIHWQQLAGWNAAWKMSHSRNEFLKHLHADVDLIYLYCHTRSQHTPPGQLTADDCLELHDAQGPGWITASELSTEPIWRHRPLVVLNGCRSLAGSPSALSPFIRRLVGREAAGVLGTEVPVWEQLATAVGTEFLARFLAGATAGNALLDTRRVLLAKQNPLGLVYTLYADAGLHLQSPVPVPGRPAMTIEPLDATRIRIGDVTVPIRQTAAPGG